MALADMPKKISAEELAALQQVFTRYQIAEAELRGALTLLAGIYKLPDGSQIDPTTGVITRPEPNTRPQPKSEAS